MKFTVRPRLPPPFQPLIMKGAIYLVIVELLLAELPLQELSVACQFESFQMAHCAPSPDRMSCMSEAVHRVADSFCSHCSDKNDCVKNNEISAVISGGSC